MTLVISLLGKPHYQSNALADHDLLLRTITAAWGLPDLGHLAKATTSALAGFFRRASPG